MSIIKKGAYTPTDLEVLQSYYKNHSHKQLAKHLGRTPYAIGSKLRKMGLLRPCKYTPNGWTAKEIALLKEHYPSKGSKATSLLIGRSANAVSGKAHLLGLKTNYNAGQFKKRA